MDESPQHSESPDAGSTALTRREFLHRSGVVGGSGLVLGALNAWGLMGCEAGPRPSLTGRPEGTRVLILGAGLAGLTVGYELDKLGYDTRILEARDRVGGVIWTVRGGSESTEIDGARQVCQFDEGQYLNVGPWRIPHHHTGILGYCRELGVPLEVFVNHNEASWVYHEESPGLAGPLVGQRVRLREVKADMRGYVAELLAQGVAAEQLDVPLTAEDRERLVSYLISEGSLDGQDLTYQGTSARGYRVPTGMVAGEADDPHDFQALLRSGLGTRFRAIESLNMQATMFQPVGGMDQIPLAFQRAIGRRLTLQAEVRSIRQASDEVRVVYRDTRSGDEREETADFCICTLPPSVLAGLDHGFSQRKAEAIGSVSYSSSAKIGLQMRRRFWEEDDQIYGGHTYTNLALGNLSFPSNDYHADKGIVLGLYRGAPLSTALANLPFEERIDYVLGEASKVHPKIREEYETGFCVFWSKIPYSLGGYANVASAEHRPALLEPEGRVYMASAAASYSPAWLEGAVQSAWHTVEELHERAMAG